MSLEYGEGLLRLSQLGNFKPAKQAIDIKRD